MEETVIITGGDFKKNQVTVYNTEGWVADWPELNQGRNGHGCGHFVNTDKKVVRQ